MSATYTRQDVPPDAVRFTITMPTQTPASSSTPFRPMSAVAAGVLFGLIVVGSRSPDAGFFGWIFNWAIAIGGGWLVFRGVKAWTHKKTGVAVRGGMQVSFTASPDGIQLPDGKMLPRADVRELLWRNWSTPGDDASTSCSLYVETVRDESFIVAPSLDEPTVRRLAGEVSGILGVPVQGGRPEPVAEAAPPAPSAGGAVGEEAVKAAARRKLEELRQKHGADIVTEDKQPMQPGDFVLRETAPESFELQRLTDSGRELVQTVPAGTMTDTIAFALARTGEANLWLQRSSAAGPAALVPRPQKSGRSDSRLADI